MKKQCLVVALAVVVCILGVAQAESPVLTNNDVIKMVQVGLNADFIVKLIVESPTDFKFTPSDLTALGQAKIPEMVFKAMAAGLTDQSMPGPAVQAGGLLATAVPRAASVGRVPAGGVLSQDPEKHRRALSLVVSINQELTLAKVTTTTENELAFKFQGITVSEEGEVLVLESERFANESFRSAFEEKLKTLIIGDDKAKEAYCYIGFRYLYLRASAEAPSGRKYLLGCQDADTTTNLAGGTIHSKRTPVPGQPNVYQVAERPSAVPGETVPTVQTDTTAKPLRAELATDNSQESVKPERVTAKKHKVDEPKNIRQQTYNAPVETVYTAVLRVAMRSGNLENESRTAGVLNYRGSLSSGFCSYIAFRGTVTVDGLPNGSTRVRLGVQQIGADGCLAVSFHDGGMRNKFANIFWSNLAGTLQTRAADLPSPSNSREARVQVAVVVTNHAGQDFANGKLAVLYTAELGGEDGRILIFRSEEFSSPTGRNEINVKDLAPALCPWGFTSIRLTWSVNPNGSDAPLPCK